MERTVIETIEINGFTVKIYGDDNPSDPREWDSLGIIAYKHRQYKLGEEEIEDPVDWLADKLGIGDVHHSARLKGYHSAYSDEYKEYLENRFLSSPKYVALPLYLYDHGGTTISTKPFSCRWDSGQVGYIYADAQRIKDNFYTKRITADIRARALAVIACEVKTYDQYMTGDCYHFTVEDANGEMVDSCGTFYGSDHEESGLLDCAKEEIPDVKGVRETGDMKSCTAHGDVIVKVYEYAGRLFEVKDDCATREATLRNIPS